MAHVVTVLAFTGLTGTARAADNVRIGLMLPYSGTFADLGKNITNGFKLAIAEKGGKIAGRDVEFVTLDDESDPAKANENANKLIKRDKVDVLVGTVHSGVALTMARVARSAGIPMIIPNAGADELTGALCAPNIFRTSFSNWQAGYGVGALMAQKHKSAVALAWKYAAGDEQTAGFKEAFEKGGGKVLKHLTLPFPNTEFQPLLTEIASIKPEAAYTFVAGAAQVKLAKDYHAAGLRSRIPLYGAFITEGTLQAQGESAQGLLTVLHYADGLETPRNKSFIESYKKAYGGATPDVFAVQGYDAAQLYLVGLEAVEGDTSKRKEMLKAMENAKLDSPRGPLSFSKSHNPVQDMYIREARGNQNVMVGVAVKQLVDPSPECKMQ
ncbi:ABC transporter substrate-binding protein [Noviherbaspirillum malthae]|uniref:ABC transporter substrate-binding protein n=1 Tax=Noviherbaspirillum malthae TaxID=1260987 RepID=UPI00188EC031|nr:ABC transporter substrate-binding protein [Noviherbaspirillum malthae]